MTITKMQNIKNVGDDVETLKPLYTSVNNVILCSHYRKSIDIPQKIENRTTIDSRYPITLYLVRRIDVRIPRYLHFHVHCNIIYYRQDKKTTGYLLTDKLIKKMWYISLKKGNPSLFSSYTYFVL